MTRIPQPGRIRKERLPNGITVLTERLPHVRSVSLGVWLRRGSRHEPVDLNGVTHFIEHLVFKGTTTRTAREIALAVDSIGGQIDAFTSKEYTCFYAKVLDTHLADAVELLGDIVRSPRFDPEEMERERQVIVEEIRMVEDAPEDLVYDLFASRVYPGHPLGRPIQGTERTISGMSRRRVLGYFRQAYRPSNLLVVAAGNLEHRRLVRLLARALGSIPRAAARSTGGAPVRVRPVVARRKKRDLEQLHLLLGVTAFPEGWRGRYPLFVLNAILGGSMSSRLFQKVREERGLAYSVYSALNAFADTGALLVYAATSPDRGDEVVGLVRDEMRALSREGPTAHEIDVAREHLKGSLMLSLESTSARMSNLARQEIYFKRQFSLGEMLREIDAVTPARVRSVARRVFNGERLALAAVGRVAALRRTGRTLAL